MKLTCVLLSILTFTMIASCKKRDHICGCVAPPVSTYYFKATVYETKNLSCGKPVLLFEDTIRLQSIIPSKGDKIVVDTLQHDLNVPGKKLWVLVRPLKEEEAFTCLAMGTWYPPAKLIDAQPDDD